MDPAQTNPVVPQPVPAAADAPIPPVQPQPIPAAPVTPEVPPAAPAPVSPQPASPPPATPPPANPVLPVQDKVTVISSASAPPQASSALPAKSHSGIGKAIFIVIFLLLFIFSGSSLAAWLIATEKIPAPSEQIKQSVSSAVFSLPFVPKTPHFVIDSFLSRPAEITSGSFDLSLALSSSDFSQYLGTSDLDISITGYADSTDPELPSADITFQAGNLFSFRVKQVDNGSYFKIDRIPAFLYALIPVPPETLEPLLANWVYSDTASLDTQARDLVNAQPQEKSASEKKYQEIVEALIKEDIVPHLTITRDTSTGSDTYRLDYSPTPEQIDSLFMHYLRLESPVPENDTDSNNQPEILPSELISAFKLSVWIDHQFLLNKLSVTGNFDPSALVESDTDSASSNPIIGSISAPSIISFGLVISISDINQSKAVTPPDSFITAEQFASQINQLLTSPSTATSEADIETSPETPMETVLGLFTAI